MKKTTPQSCCAESLKRLCWFALSIVLVSACLGWIAQLFVELPWWKIFRRCVSVATAAVLWVFIRRVYPQSFSSLGLGPFRQAKGQLAQGVCLGLGAVALVGGLYLMTGVCRIMIHPDQIRVARTLIGFVPAAAIIAVLEELVFRGYVLQQLLACSKPLAIVASSAAYALVHLRPTTVWPGSIFELGGLFILGWVLALSVLRTKQLHLAIGLHAGLAYCARVNKLLVEFPHPSLQWLVGTNRLVNGLIPWLVLLGLGSVVERAGASPRTEKRLRRETA